MIGADPGTVVTAAIVAASITSAIVGAFLGYRAGYHAGWVERHDRMIVSARSARWADDNRIDP